MASQDWLEKDFYKILGVSKDVSQAELKKAYRKLAKDNHPDLHPGDAKAEARFKDISEAYDVLSDLEQRKEYDAIPALASRQAARADLKMSFRTFLVADFRKAASQVDLEDSVASALSPVRICSPQPV
jgi:DnaJ-class molecular chaperone